MPKGIYKRRARAESAGTTLSASEIRRLARVRYAEPSGDDIEVDDTAVLSYADNGVWVSAWVWVTLDGKG